MLTVVSFKLRRFENHVRIVMTEREEAPTGVDLYGAEASAIFERGRLLFEQLEKDGGRVRALSVDLERERLVATFDTPGQSKPMARRVVPSDDDFAVVHAAWRDLVPALRVAALRQLEQRAGAHRTSWTD